MKLPRRYPYSPRLWLLVLNLGAGVGWIAVVALICGCRPNTISLSLGLVLIVLGLLLAVRRLAFNCYLVLESDALMLPTGFLRVRTTRIPYMNIERVWQIHLPWMAVLCVGTKQGKFEVLSGMLPETRSYVAIGEFLNSRVQNSSKT